jgi:fucose permease
VTWLAFLAFVVFGFLLVLVGASQEALAEALSLDLGATGLLGALLSLGIAAGVLASGPVVDRYPRRPLFGAASVLGAAALASVHSEIAYAELAAVLVVVGFCAGVWEVVLNTGVAEEHGVRSARPLSLVHAGATAGAVVGAPLLAWGAAQAGFPLSFRWVAAGFFFFGVWGVIAPLDAHRPSRAAAGSNAGISAGIVPYAGIAACYVGVETTVTLFAVPWARDGLGLEAGRGVTAISAFWLGLLAGRLGLYAQGGVAGHRLLVAAGLGGALVLGLGVGLDVPLPELILGLVGVALSVVFPVFVSLATQRFPNAPGTATGVAVGAGAAGGFVAPWLTGRLGDAVGIEVAFASLAVWSLALAAFAFSARRR